MAHNIDMTGNRANIAFLGQRSGVWHRLGQEMQDGMTIDQWADAAGLAWHAVKVPAIALLHDAAFTHIPPLDHMMKVDGQNFVVRSDNGHPLGYVSDRYQPVQPRDVLDWFDRYIAVDDRFKLDVAGSLKQGEIIWATATFRDSFEVAGDAHTLRLLMTTTFDGSGSTINRGCTERVVCNNTLDIALAEPGSVIRTRHSTKFDARKVSQDLARVAQATVKYKAMGDAMAQTEMAKDDVSRFFKELLEIPFDAKTDDVSARKMGQFSDLSRALSVTRRERSSSGAIDAWECLQAITRYVDHDKQVRRNGVGEDEKRFTSAQFGSGAVMKAKAWDLLMPRIKDKVLVAV